ncbi:hypothetical protein KX729_31825 [Rhizobium sp. XQZ8]|uniref:hypothetical protein n=1 Tax=Rhizobium populisoli TaxID=2859785 RepID=UPI001CA4E2B2|nr:hypothetical protein [Rhizobium populisoli]MBW6425976.1 hypothetical protein [Rhizobium populisoli]
MKRTVLLLSGLLVATSVYAAAERPATEAEIEKIAVGKIVNGRMSYGKDGSYSYAGGDKGKYTNPPAELA